MNFLHAVTVRPIDEHIDNAILASTDENEIAARKNNKGELRMRRTLLVGMLVTAAFVVVPAAALAQTVSIVKAGSGESLKVGAAINGEEAAFSSGWPEFHWRFLSQENSCLQGGVGFTGDLTKTNSSSATVEGVSGQPGEECVMHVSGFGNLPEEMASFAVPGQVEFFPNGTGLMPIEFKVDYTYSYNIQCRHFEYEPIPFTWKNNSGGAKTLQISVSEQQLEGESWNEEGCPYAYLTATFDLTDEEGKALEVKVTP